MNFVAVWRIGSSGALITRRPSSHVLSGSCRSRSRSRRWPRLIGLSLSRSALASVGLRPLLLGVILWVAVAAVALPLALMAGAAPT